MPGDTITVRSYIAKRRKSIGAGVLLYGFCRPLMHDMHAQSAAQKILKNSRDRQTAPLPGLPRLRMGHHSTPSTHSTAQHTCVNTRLVFNPLLRLIAACWHLSFSLRRAPPRACKPPPLSLCVLTHILRINTHSSFKHTLCVQTNSRARARALYQSALSFCSSATKVPPRMAPPARTHCGSLSVTQKRVLNIRNFSMCTGTTACRVLC